MKAEEQYKHDWALLKRIGKKIKKLRVSLGMTQEQLSSESNLSMSTISRVELGKKHFQICVLYDLAKALKVKPSKLLE